MSYTFFQVLQDLRIEWHRSQAKHFIFYDYCNCQKFKSYQFITYHDISFLGYKFYGSASSSTSGALQARTWDKRADQLTARVTY